MTSISRISDFQGQLAPYELSSNRSLCVAEEFVTYTSLSTSELECLYKITETEVSKHPAPMNKFDRILCAHNVSSQFTKLLHINIKLDSIRRYVYGYIKKQDTQSSTSTETYTHNVAKNILITNMPTDSISEASSQQNSAAAINLTATRILDSLISEKLSSDPEFTKPFQLKHAKIIKTLFYTKTAQILDLPTVKYYLDNFSYVILRNLDKRTNEILNKSLLEIVPQFLIKSQAKIWEDVAKNISETLGVSASPSSLRSRYHTITKLTCLEREKEYIFQYVKTKGKDWNSIANIIKSRQNNPTITPTTVYQWYQNKTAHPHMPNSQEISTTDTYITTCPYSFNMTENDLLSYSRNSTDLDMFDNAYAFNPFEDVQNVLDTFNIPEIPLLQIQDIPIPSQNLQQLH